MNTAVIIKHDHETKYLVLFYTDEKLIKEERLTQAKANKAKTDWEAVDG